MRYLILIVLSAIASLSVGAAEKDTPGAKDHPLFKRHPEAWIIDYDQKTFDEYQQVVRPLSESFGEAAETLTGKLTRITYHVESGVSVTELFYSYKQSLKKAGFREILSCKNNECGNAAGFEEADRRMIFSADFRYLAAASEDDRVRVAIGFMDIGGGVNRMVLNVVERGELENQVAVASSDELARSISNSGRVVLGGIFFDHDRTELKPASEDAIKQVATLLKKEPALRLHVVGHTDSTGDFQHNLLLSKNRAEAVVKHLITAYSVAPDRLDAQGVASLAPVAANDADEGRARNRRVELVKQ